MKRLLPRARGKAWKDGAGYRWTVWITIGSQPVEEGIELTSLASEPYLNEASAIHAMKTKIPEILALCSEAMGAGKPVDFIDLKAGEIVSAKEFTKSPFGKEADSDT